ncbi:MAG: MGMT family protein [Pseudomonas sp.]|uniref:MGMT family protein n=1 Tax=Pseudomonas sp. TaxID=306 RepID=UPI003BB7DA26
MIGRQPPGQGEAAKHAASPLSAASQEARREALYLTLAQVPAGKVVSYGQLAELAGLGRAARWVGRSLSQLPPGTTLPWHRVIAASGRLSLPAGSVSGAEQRARLRSEGVLVINDRVDIRRHGWRPMEHSG